jgi:23S rRNA pseudouridine1911/1915/1917 synthase
MRGLDPISVSRRGNLARHSHRNASEPDDADDPVVFIPAGDPELEGGEDDDELEVGAPDEPLSARQRRPKEKIEIVVRKNFHVGRRIDAYVVARLQDFSRSEVQRWIDDGELTVNGRTVKPSSKIQIGDVIECEIPSRKPEKPTPEDIPISVLYEDEHFLVLNKQADLLVHPGRGRSNWSGTLINALQFHFDTLSSIGGDIRPGIIHRLDRDTTGVIVVGKQDLAHREIAMQFEARKVEKEYRAICYGEVPRDKDYINKPIGRHASVREKMAIRMEPNAGRPALTFYETLERFKGFTAVRLELHTGRTHQIRVHLQSIGFPVVADKAYASRGELPLADVAGPAAVAAVESGEFPATLIARQALHAYRLKFTHPMTGSEMEFIAPLPDDMSRTLAALRQYRTLRG